MTLRSKRLKTNLTNQIKILSSLPKSHNTDFPSHLTMEEISLSSCFTATLIGAPIQRIQVLLQTQDLIQYIKPGKGFKGAIDCFKRIRKEEHTKYLWRGGAAYLLSNLSYQIYDVLRAVEDDEEEIEIIKKEYRDEATGETRVEVNQRTINPRTPLEGESSKSIFESSIISQRGAYQLALTVVWGFLVHPLEVLYVRMACDYGPRPSKSFAGMTNTIQTLFRAGGMKALYRGYVPYVLNSIASQNIASSYINLGKETYQDTAIKFACDTAMYPFLVVSSRMMMETANPLAKFNGMIDCFQSTYKDFGIKGFFKGYQINLFLYGLHAFLTASEEVAKYYDKKSESA